MGCLVLGGKEMDKIFLACGQTIKGITKKGKEFFKFGANLTEDIKSMAVLNKEGKIFTGGDFLYNEFVECKVGAATTHVYIRCRCVCDTILNI